MDNYRHQKSAHFVEPTEDNDLNKLRSNDLMDINRENEYVNAQVMTDVRRLMDALPAPQREVVYMRFYQDLSFKEISEITGVSINTSLGRMRYALINMRRMARQHNIHLNMEL
jgi:RNA polymerase sigma-70 factor (ECF subfamily)